MSSSYLTRLLCISLASLFLLHTALGTLIGLLSPALIRWAGRLRPQMAARLLLIARILPAVVSVFLVAGLCIPSFLWLEQEAGTEQIGLLCLSAAALGMTIAARAISRSLSALFRSRRYLRQIRRAGSGTQWLDRRPRGWITDAPHAFIFTAGVLHPRVFVSRDIVEALSREQLAAALRHERAHRDSHDNLKRLLILAAPGLLPFIHGFRDLERAWTRFTEWAADDRAVAGSSRRSLSLAAALVRVARMGAGPNPQLLVTSLVGGGEDLSARIDRLLQATPVRERPQRISAPRITLALLLASTLPVMMLQPATMIAVHELLEELIQ